MLVLTYSIPWASCSFKNIALGHGYMNIIYLRNADRNETITKYSRIKKSCSEYKYDC